MDFLTLAKARYSCRSYQKKPVEQEKLQTILEAARVAPTGCNRQPFRLLVIQQQEGFEKLSKAARAFGAPLAILVCADEEEVWTRPNDGKKISDIDASIVTDHMMLTAKALGLDSVWVCNFKPDVLRREFSIPHCLTPVNLLYIGYAADDPPAANRHEQLRKPLDALVSYETL